MKKVIFNADDFGLCPSLNEGIIACHLEGVLTSTTAMVNYISVDELKKYIEAYPNLGFGIHLNLTYGQPVESTNTTLVDEKGVFKRSNTKEPLNLDEVRSEFVAQIEKFLKTGHRPTHIDSHHHIHNRELILPLVEEIAVKYELAVRNNNNQTLDDLYKTYFSDLFYNHRCTHETLYNIIEKNCFPLEIMCHPGYRSEELTEKTIYNDNRENELVILKSEALKNYLKKNQIRLINYGDLLT